MADIPIGHLRLMSDDIELVLHQYKIAVQAAERAINAGTGWVEACDKLIATESAVLRHLRTYGDAREAAGYATGVAARLSPEKMRAAAAGWREFDYAEDLTGEAAMIDRICSAIDAALRGEVKP